MKRKIHKPKLPHSILGEIEQQRQGSKIDCAGSPS